MAKAAHQITVDDLAADKAAALARTPVSRETEARLDRYVALLLDWQAKTNLIAPSTLPRLWTRHVADSLQLLKLAPDARRWADLGSGGGFPGIVLACVMAERGGDVDLVERNGKKAAFLREALRVTGSPGAVHAADIGDFVDSVASAPDCVTARALFLKGQDVESELTEATKYWNIEPVLHPSRSGGQGWIVDVCRLSPRSRENAAMQHKSRDRASSRMPNKVPNRAPHRVSSRVPK